MPDHISENPESKKIFFKLSVYFADFIFLLPLMIALVVRLRTWSPLISIGLSLALLIAYHFLLNYFFRRTIGDYFLFQISNTQYKKYFFIFILLITIFLFQSLNPNILQESKLEQCHSFDQNLKSWSSHLEPNPTRVSAALAYFEAGLLSQKCLAKEANISLKSGSHDITAKLALFTSGVLKQEAKDQLAGQIYAACSRQPETEACQTFSDLLEISKPRLPASTLPDPVASFHSEHFKIHKLKNLEQQKKYQELTQILSEQTPMPSFVDFYAPLKIKALWLTERKTDAKASYEAAMQFLPEAQHLFYEREMCELEVAEGCPIQKAKSCNNFAKDFETTNQHSDSLEFTYALASRCLADDNIRYEHFQKFAQSKRSRAFLEASRLIQNHQQAEAKIILHSIIDVDPDHSYADLARISLIQITEDPLELSEIESHFLSRTKINIESATVGILLMKKLEKNDEYLRASQIALKVIDLRPYQIELYSIALFYSQRAGDFQSARLVSKLRQEREALLLSK